jgi:hypothetical protein
VANNRTLAETATFIFVFICFRVLQKVNGFTVDPKY